MTTNKSIKVIKRGERAAQEAAAALNVEPKKGAHEAARDMVATVTEWVSEFQQKRRTETTNALKTLFPDTTPQAG
jgi:dsDNA-specific endonuclease/ATPase MutS2